MSRTRHIHQRISQRGIASRLLDLTAQFGVDCGDKIILDRKNTESLLSEIDKVRKDLLEIHIKGGLVVVESDGTQITAYNLNSYSRKKSGDTYATQH